MGWWVAVSVGAGLTEEITYRGVLFQLWSRLTPIPLAVGLCALVFALVHFHSGARSMAIIFVMALVFHAIVWWTGSLYTAIAVHAIYDLAAGIIFMRLMRSVPDPLEAV